MPWCGGIYLNLGTDVSGTPDSITRIAAQIVTGVGFLGAGAVIQDRGGIHGLTTAATIWLVASIGMACGARLYYLAIITTVLALAVLIGLGHVDKYFEPGSDEKTTQEPLTKPVLRPRRRCRGGPVVRVVAV